MITTMYEAYDRFDEMLDESGPVTVAGLEFYPSTILKVMDLIAYETHFNDYMDACGIDTDELED